MEEKLKVNTIATKVKEDVITINKEIKNCNQDNLFNFVNSHFSIFFLDLPEITKFIKYLIDNKGNITIKDLLNNFKDILEEFRKED